MSGLAQDLAAAEGFEPENQVAAASLAALVGSLISYFHFMTFDKRPLARRLSPSPPPLLLSVLRFQSPKSLSLSHTLTLTLTLALTVTLTLTQTAQRASQPRLGQQRRCWHPLTASYCD